MFDTLVVHPIYNLLVAIYGILPGNDLGISLIVFTIIVRIALWPLLKKQLHQSKVMRELQPELRKIKKAAKGDRQKEAALMMELYKEKGINPVGSIGLTIIQLPIFIGVFQAARKLTEHTDQIGAFTYDFVKNIPQVQSVIENHHNFNFISLGFIDLSKKAIDSGVIYWPIMIVGLLAVVIQFKQSKQIMPQTKEKKKLRDIMRESASTGKQPDQEDMSAAMGNTMLYMMPFLTIAFILASHGAMVFYLLATSVIGYLQQSRILNQDTEEMEQQVEVVSVKKTSASKSAPKSESKSKSAEPVVKKHKGSRVVTKSRIVSGK